MKQHITVEQAKMLPQKVIANIDDNLYSAMYFYSKLEHEPRWDFAANLLTIGKMIEILGDKLTSVHYGQKHYGENQDKLEYRVYVMDENFVEMELCDALWEATKYVLAEGQKEV